MRSRVISTNTLQTKLCNDCFGKKKKNRTLDRHRFFKAPAVWRNILLKFWQVLNGLAAMCGVGEITTTLVLEKFILHTSNQIVQEKLCTEPNEPDQALEFAFAFEVGFKGKRLMEHKRPKLQNQW